MIKKSLQEFTKTMTIDTSAKGRSSRCYPATFALHEREMSLLEQQQQQRDDLSNAIANNNGKGWEISSSLLETLKETTTTAFVTTGFPDVRVGGLDMMFPPTTRMEWSPYNNNHYFYPTTNDSISIDSEIIIKKTIISSSSPNRNRGKHDCIDKVVARRGYRKRKRGSGLVRSRHLLCLSSILDAHSSAGAGGGVPAQPPSQDSHHTNTSEVEGQFPSKRINAISTHLAPIALSRLCINNSNRNNEKNDAFASFPWSNAVANEDDNTNANNKNKNINEEARGHQQSLSMYIRKEASAAAPTVNTKTTIPSAISLHENAQSSSHQKQHQRQYEQQSDTLIHSLLLRCPFPTCP